MNYFLVLALNSNPPDLCLLIARIIGKSAVLIKDLLFLTML
jgi:hypothetical protein